MNLFWRPKEGIFYRSWIGDGKHSVSVDAQLEGSGYSAAFKISGESCELWLFPTSVRVRRKSDSFSDNITRRAFILNLPKKDIEFDKELRHDVVQAGEINENQTDFIWVRYALKVKQISSEDELRFLEWQKSASIVPERQIVRRRGTAIIDTDRGILLISSSNRLYILPGGGAKKEERRMDAAIREVKAETGLEAKSCKYLFSFDEPQDKKLRNLHKVFLIDVDQSNIKPVNQRKHIEFWHEGSRLNLGKSTNLIIDRYMKEFKTSVDASKP